MSLIISSSFVLQFCPKFCLKLGFSMSCAFSSTQYPPSTGGSWTSPLSLLPCLFQDRAWRVVLDVGCLRMIQIAPIASD